VEKFTCLFIIALLEHRSLFLIQHNHFPTLLFPFTSALSRVRKSPRWILLVVPIHTQNFQSTAAKNKPPLSSATLSNPSGTKNSTSPSTAPRAMFSRFYCAIKMSLAMMTSPLMTWRPVTSHTSQSLICGST